MADGTSNFQLPPTGRVAALHVVLDQQIQAIGAFTAEQYARVGVGMVDGSAGAHVRHCLDHVVALLEAVESGTIDYDQRKRGTAIEADPQCAIEEIHKLMAGLDVIGDFTLTRPITVTTMLDAEGAPIECESSVGRELSFVISHTVHHNAIIAAIARSFDLSLPTRFGYAPSTIAHLNQQN